MSRRSAPTDNGWSMSRVQSNTDIGMMFMMPIPPTSREIVDMRIKSRVVYFFFQAEDGIRDRTVTGVQTCALPILNLLKVIIEIRQEKYDVVINLHRFLSTGLMTVLSGTKDTRGFNKNPLSFFFKKTRSEERRVGKECRSR